MSVQVESAAAPTETTAALIEPLIVTSLLAVSTAGPTPRGTARTLGTCCLFSKSVTVFDWLSACTCFAWVLARGVVIFVRPHLSLLLLLGLPALATATLADRAIVSTAGLVILVCLLPEPV